ncbi:hypothetical protein QR98_0011900 [Sarcoptes scabiei]|uniref:Uncharacterized protein n=1 Tax=Sarcoptes scabiei TaxID=52283 RepID=A0A131ZVT9_SARSC|nr:hypothetical protein QR98_0011900 [Sarcoptes scabiei]
MSKIISIEKKICFIISSSIKNWCLSITSSKRKVWAMHQFERRWRKIS